MSIEIIATYRNKAEGLEALVMDGNAEFNYRVVFRDSDADETLFVRFKHNYFEAMQDVADFLLGDFVHVESETDPDPDHYERFLRNRMTRLNGARA
jgi:hypothetical protein